MMENGAGRSAGVLFAIRSRSRRTRHETGWAMQLAAELQSDTIRARLNYIVDTGIPPVHYIDWPEMAEKAIPAQYEVHEVTIRDGRPQRDRFRLDTHGFVFVDHETQVKDFVDQGEVKCIYEPEVQALIKRYSGASEVVVINHGIRFGDEARRNATGARAPVKRVHSDYTENTARWWLREIVSDAEAERRMKKRFAIIQVWRPIRGDVMIDPLAICDARSIPRECFILVQRRYPNRRTGEFYQIAYHPSHVWFWFPRMTRNEALVFKVFDSDENKPARRTPHTAFDHPAPPPNAPPRESIETRMFAFFD
jgi:hypothetical protein